MKIKVNSDNEKLILTGGFTPNSGARIELYGKDSDNSSDNNGKFIITAKGQTEDEAVNLVGSPAGILLWNNMEIIPCFTGLNHNGIYRGKDLTAYFESGDMSDAIADGTFADIYPGDYIIKSVTIDGTTYEDVKWIVMDLDYHLHSGDVETTAHHVVLMPETILGTQAMNATDTTAGGYVGSVMWTTHIPKVATGIEAAFGADHILSHRELLSNAVDTSIKSCGYNGWAGAASNWAWTDVRVNLANEPMVYGSHNVSSSLYDVGECVSQLAAFRLNTGLKCSARQWNWLRVVAYSASYAYAGGSGEPSYYGASGSGGGVRPYFLLR